MVKHQNAFLYPLFSDYVHESHDNNHFPSLFNEISN